MAQTTRFATTTATTTTSLKPHADLPGIKPIPVARFPPLIPSFEPTDYSQNMSDYRFHDFANDLPEMKSNSWMHAPNRHGLQVEETDVRVDTDQEEHSQYTDSARSNEEQNPTDENAEPKLIDKIDDIIESFTRQLQTEELLKRAPESQQGGYSREFVLSLEEHYREQLNSFLSTIHEAMQRRLSQKENQLQQFHEDVKQLQQHFANKEDSFLTEIERLHEEKEAYERQIKVELDTIERRHEQEIRDQEAKHMKDLEKASSESESAIKRVCEWARSQLIALDSKLESQRLTFQKQMETLESSNARDVAKLQQDKEQSIAETRQLLALTEIKLLEAKREIENVNTARQEDLSALRNQIGDYLRVIQQKDADHNKEIQNLHREYSIRESELKKQMQQDRLSKEVDKQELQYQVELLREKITKLQEYIQSTEQRYTEELRRLSEENQRIVSSFTSAQAQMQIESQQYAKIVSMARDYERELQIIRNELLLSQNEESRLRDENAQFRVELTRLDKIIYGRNSSLVKGTAKERPIPK